MERNLIRQRASEGIAAARARGRKGGRPRVMTPERLRYASRALAISAA
jgi:DNA invertase Pin-like site-specific DNA recombinase